MCSKMAAYASITLFRSMIPWHNATTLLHACNQGTNHVTSIVQTQQACLTKHRAVKRRCYTNVVSQPQIGGPTALQDVGQACNSPWQQTQTSQQANSNVECLLTAVKQKEVLTSCQLDKLANALSIPENQSQLYTYWGVLIDYFHMCGYTPPKGFLLQLDRAILKLCTAGVKRVYAASYSQTTAFMTMLTADIQRHCDTKEQPPLYTFPVLLESRYHQDDVICTSDTPDGGKRMTLHQSFTNVPVLLSNYWSAMQNAVQLSGKPFDWPFDQTKALISAQASEPIIRRCSPMWRNQFVLAHNVISDILTFKELDEFAWKDNSDGSMQDVSKCLVQSLQLLRHQLQHLDRQRHSRGARETAESGSDESNTVMRECRQAWNLAVHTLKLFLNWQYTHLAQISWGTEPLEELLGLLCDASMLNSELVLDLKTCKDMCASNGEFVDSLRLLLYATILLARQPNAWNPPLNLYLEMPHILVTSLRHNIDVSGFDTLELIMLLQALGAIFRMTGHPQDGSGSWESHGTMYVIWRNLHLPDGHANLPIGNQGHGDGQQAHTTWNRSQERTLNYRIGLRIAEGLSCATPEEQMYLLAKIRLLQ